MTETETITAITPYEGEHDYGPEAGFQVHTTEQIITLAIDNGQSCCEQWGYFLSEDDTDKFIGAQLRGVTITDTNLTTKVFTTDWDAWDAEQEKDHIYLEDGATLFVNVETDRGKLQFAAYNAHNGYYGHAARVVSQQLKHEVVL